MTPSLTRKRFFAADNRLPAFVSELAKHYPIDPSRLVDNADYPF
jgi:hypothetical protein